ncbi:hypothetical protein AOC36_08015 [Erysipelothrix larvae]|uniref:Gram-positive cocci surface proteins LPxTG domain-containing protein n=1 Tax=Erysipelothrix larvae TaxID=1514105 RepID=A0A109UH92_9FIRM|nr:DUF5979 domain-containing protein [Erysipelothrix larvae]AMC93932.1 hypothetical protein AOC36_08015 [Erysipelothrix larvae]
MRKRAYKKIKSGVIALFVMLLTISTLSAWYDDTQHKTANFGTEFNQCVVILDNSELNTSKMLEGASFELYRKNELGDERIGDIYTTNESGEVTLHLESGDYYFKGIMPPSGYDFYLDEQLEDPLKFEFSVDCSLKKYVLVQTYSVCNTCSLELLNIVKNSNGTMLSDDQRNLEFEYVITFSDGKSYPYTFTGSNQSGVIDGTGSVFLKHLESILFENLPCGLEYSIQTIPKEGYTPDITDVTGILKGHDDVTITHVIDEEKGDGSFILTKHVVNRDGSQLSLDQLLTEFEFTITFEDGMTYFASLNGSIPFELASGDTIMLKHYDTLVVQTHKDNLKYTIKETDASNQGYSSSHNEIQGTTSRDTVMEYVVTNTYLNDTPEAKTGSLIVKKDVVGTTLKDSFTFTVSFSEHIEELTVSIDGGNPVKYDEGSTLQIPANSTAVFENIPYGTTYEIHEQDLETYQELVNTVSGVVDRKDTTVTFKNRFIPEPQKTLLEIRKEVVGEGDLNKAFEFTLTIDGVTESFTLKHGQSKTIEVKPGAHYEVKEKDYQQEGYILNLFNGKGNAVEGTTTHVKAVNTFDKSIINNIIEGEVIWNVPDGYDHVIPDEIEVCVYNGDGVEIACTTTNKDQDWKFEFEVPKYDKDGNEIEYYVRTKDREHFEIEYLDNYVIKLTYRVPTSLQFDISKIIKSDGNAPDETFAFKLTGMNNAPVQDTSTVLINGEGSASFGEITFTKVGTYTYVIREIVDRTSEYEYDMDPVTVQVSVSEQRLKLVVDQVTYTKAGQIVDSITFTNTYEKRIDEEPKPVKPSKPDLPETGTEHRNTAFIGFLLVCLGGLTFALQELRRFAHLKKGSHNESNS